MRRFLNLLVMFTVVMMLAAPAFAGKGKVKLVYVEWSCATASVNVMKAVLQEKLGYDVEVLPVSAAAMWQAVASGDMDGLTTAWLPVTHGHYYKKLKDDVVDLGPNLEGAGIGLVVPTYVSIDSISEMKGKAEKFDGDITGIDPGAGIMSKTEKAIEEYNLSNYELMEGSGATMTAVLQNKIKNKEWVVVTGWTPHWKFARWDLKYLEDPKGIYGGAEKIHTIVRKDLEKDMPEVYKVLDNFHWTLAEIGEVQGWNAEGGDPYDSAKRWIKENPDRVNEWIK